MIFKNSIKHPEHREQRFSFRKFSLGTASVLVGSLLFMGGNISADEVSVTSPELEASVTTAVDEGVSKESTETKTELEETVLETAKLDSEVSETVKPELSSEVSETVKPELSSEVSEASDVTPVTESLAVTVVDSDPQASAVVTPKKKTVGYKATNTLPTVPTNNATARPENEGDKIDESLAFRAKVDANATPVDGYTIKAQNLSGEYAKFNDPVAGRWTFGLFQAETTGNYFALSEDQAGKQYISTFSSEGVRVKTVELPAIGQSIEIDEKLLSVGGSATEIGTANADALHRDSSTLRITGKLVSNAWMSYKRIVDLTKVDQGSRFSNLLDVGLPSAGKVNAIHYIPEVSKREEEISMTAKRGENYTTKQLDRLNAQYDVVIPINQNGVVASSGSSIAHVGQVFTDNYTIRSQKLERDIAVRVVSTVLDTSGKMKVETYYDGVLQPVLVSANKKVEGREIWRDSGKTFNELYPVGSPTGPWSTPLPNPFSDRMTEEWRRANKIASNEYLEYSNQRPVQAISAGAVWYYYTREKAEVVFKDVTNPNQVVDLASDKITGVYGKGGSAITKEGVKQQTQRDVDAIIKKYTDMGYTVVRNDFTTNPKMNPKTTDLNLRENDTERQAREIARQERNKKVIEIHIRKDSQEADLKFFHVGVDGTSNKTQFPNTTYEARGNSGAAITFADYATKLAELKRQGYEVVTDGFANGGTFDNNTAVKQHYEVVLKPRIEPIKPNDPKTPGTPVDPNDPNSPKWPESVRNLNLKEGVTRTVTYYKTDANGNNPVQEGQPVTETVEFTRSATVNLVTGEIVYGEWTAKNNNTVLKGHKLPVFDGYQAFKAETTVNGLTVNPTPSSTEEDITRVEYNSKDVVEKVYYKPVTPPTPTEKPQSAKVVFYRDSVAPANKLTESNTKADGKTGDVIPQNLATPKGADTAATIKYYEDRGYVLKSNGFTNNPTFDNVDGNVQEVPVVLESKEVIIPPTDPKTPNTPVYPDPNTPNEPIPDSPRYPDGLKETDLNKTVTRTIRYWIEKENGEKAFEDKVETVKFTRSAVIDSVTGQVKRYTDWTTGNFPEVTSPAKDGYTVDRASVPTKAYTSNAEVEAAKDYVENVIYTPDPVKEGKVIVNYVDENGTPLKDPVEDMPNSPVDTPYTTEDRRIPEIVTEDGTRYVRVPNLTEGNENGKIVEGTTTVTYVYKKIGNWIPLIPGEPNPPKNPYPFDPNNPNDPVPPTPEVPGKPGVPVVPYVPGYTPKDPGGNPLVPVDPKDPNKGYIPPVPEKPGKDTPIPYTPDPVKEGKVIVNYVDENGTPLKDPVEDMPNSPVDTPYTTEDRRIPEIVTEDGTRYVRVPNLTEGNENGKIVEGTTTVTYVYKKIGNWIPLIPGEPNPPKNPYPFDPNNPNDPVPPTPEVPGKPGVPVVPYVPGYTPKDPGGNPLVPVDPKDPNKGYIPPVPEKPGKDTPIPYTPDPVKEGKVIVNYVDENGTPLKDPVEDMPNSPVDTPYTTEDRRIPEIVTEDGTRYVRVPNLTEGNENGKIVEGTTTVTYVYKKIGNWIPLIPGEPNPPKNPYPFDPNNPNDPVPPTPEVPGKPGVPVVPYVPGYTPKDPGGNPLVPVDPKDPNKGYIPPVPEKPGKDTPIPYTPDPVKEGKVIVNYVDENGTPLKDPVEDMPNSPVDTPYTTEDRRIPEIVTEDGTRYVRVPNLTEGNENGKIVEGTTTVTYVYKKIGNWIPLIPGEPNPPKNPYPFDPNNPNDPVPPTPEVPGKPGVPVVPYVPGYTPKDPGGNPLVPVDPKDPNKGYIPPVPEKPGKDTPIPYTPDPVKEGKVIVNYVDENGTPLKDPVEDMPNSPVDTPYTTEDRRIPEIVTEDGTRYVRVPNLTEGNENGKIVEGTTTVTYVYKKIGNWIPLIPGEPNPPKNPYPFDPNNPNDPVPPTPEVPGKPGVPVVPYVPGYTPKDPGGNPLVPVDPKDPNKGYIPPVPEKPGKDTPIPYTPDPVKEGKVIVNYVDENGTPLKDPVEDMPNSPVDTPYTTEDRRIPEIVTEDGTRYVRVPNLTEGNENGKIVEGTTTVTYVYKKIGNWIPLIPGEPNPPKNPYPFDPNNPNDPVPPTPEVPGKPGVPVVPYVPGYTPKDPGGNPLVPVDPKDPNKGYIPPVPEKPGKDTPIPYTPDPVKEGKVIVNYVDENGTPLKDPVEDMPNSPVDTPYTTEDRRIPEIVTEDGTRYVRVPNLTEGNENGKIVEGTTTVTYVYKKIGNWIPLIPGEPNPPKNPYPFDPNNPNDPVPPTPEVPGKPGVPVVPYVPGYTPKDPGGNPLVPVDPKDPNKGYIPPVPEKPGKDTPIPYTPDPVKEGKVIVNYVDENGTPLKDPVEDMPNSPVDTPYTTEDRRIPEIVTEDGTRYVRVPNLTEGNENGKIVEGTTTVTYVYKKIGNWIPLIPGEPNPPKNPYPFDPNNPNDPVPPTPEVPGKPGVPVVPYVPGYTPKDPGGNPLVPVDPKDPNKGYIPPVPEKPGKDTPIPYTPNPTPDPEPTPTPDPAPKPKPNPGKPVPPTPEKPVTPSTPAPVADKAAVLPNTGEESSSATVMGAALLVAALGFGTARRRKED